MKCLLTINETSAHHRVNSSLTITEMRSQLMPGAFKQSQPGADEDHGYSGLTKTYIEENRRTKFSGSPESGRQYTGKTLEMMNEIIAARKGAVR